MTGTYALLAVTVVVGCAWLVLGRVDTRHHNRAGGSNAR